MGNKPFWLNPVDGDATDPLNWTNGIGTCLNAIVDVAGTYNLQGNGDFVARSVTSDPVSGTSLNEDLHNTIHYPLEPLPRNHV